MSEFKVEVVPVQLLPHANADKLSIVHVYGWQCVVVTDEWNHRNKGAYIPPDSVVPDTEEYAWLNGKLRIKAKRYRGEWSQGLLVPAPEGSQIGEDVAEQLGIVHYEPELKILHGNKITGSSSVAGPKAFLPKYDVETMYRYTHVFEENELVVGTEKIHGANGRWYFDGEQMHYGSRNEWKNDKSLWAQALNKHPEIKEYLRSHPKHAVYGEVYGWIQDLRYGAKPGEIHIAVFDILEPGGWWLDWEQLKATTTDYNLPLVPILYEGNFNLEKLIPYASGHSHIQGADNIREGIVVKPFIERTVHSIGRVQLKIVSNFYLEKSK